MRGNRILLLVLMIGTIALASIRGGTITYTLFYIAWGAPIISGLYLLYVYKSFRIEQKLGNTLLTKGEKVSYGFAVKNKSIVTCTGMKITFFERLSEFETAMPKEKLSLIPGQAYERETLLKLNYRGEYSVGIEKVEVTDFLNLFKATYRYPKTMVVKVLPVVPHFENLVINVEEFSENIQIRNSGKEALYPDVELRKYVTGDSVRAINWKASAKGGELFSRKYVDETNAEVLLVPDFCSTGLVGADRVIVEDKIIASALGIADYLYRKNVKVNVLFFDKMAQMLSIHSREDLDSFYARCAQVVFNATSGCAELLLQSMLRGYTQIIIITHELSKKNAAVAGELAAKGSFVELVYVGDGNPKDEIGETMDSINITQISSEQEVGDVLDRKI